MNHFGKPGLQTSCKFQDVNRTVFDTGMTIRLTIDTTNSNS